MASPLPLLGPGTTPKEGAIEVAPADEGRRLYAALCRSCHGPDGSARTPLARDLNPPPAELGRCGFKYRSTPSGSLPTDRDLLHTLYVGLPGSAMPSFGTLVALPALRALVREVKARCPRFTAEPPDPPLRVPAPPLFSMASARRGRRIYQAQRCAACHGERGRGDGPAARSLRDATGRPLRPRDYSAGVFRSGFRREDIYRAFSTGLDGTPMPALPDELPGAQRWDLTHYIVSLSHGRDRLLRYLEQGPGWYEPVWAWGLPWR